MLLHNGLVCFQDDHKENDLYKLLYSYRRDSSNTVKITSGNHSFSVFRKVLRNATPAEIIVGYRVGQHHSKDSLLKEMYNKLDLEVGDKIRVLRNTSPYYKKGTILTLQTKTEDYSWSFVSDTDLTPKGFRLISIHGSHLSEGIGWERVKEQIFKEFNFESKSINHKKTLINVLESIGYTSKVQDNSFCTQIKTHTDGSITDFIGIGPHIKYENIAWLDIQLKEDL